MAAGPDLARQPPCSSPTGRFPRTSCAGPGADVLPIDTFDGQAWIGVTPFEVTGLRLRGTLLPPVLARFPEINVRTYTTLDGAAGHRLQPRRRQLAAVGARATYRLPYFRSRMAIARGRDRPLRGGTSRRQCAPARSLRARRHGLPRRARGMLEHVSESSATALVDGNVQRAEIHHPPWPLQLAQARIEENTMAQAAGVPLPAYLPVLHYAARQDAAIWGSCGPREDRVALPTMAPAIP